MDPHSLPPGGGFGKGLRVAYSQIQGEVSELA